MTTDQELRTLLTAEAHGPTHQPDGWDQVLARGRRHRRVARARQGLLLSAAAVVVAAGMANLLDNEGGHAVVTDPAATTAPGPIQTNNPPSTTKPPALAGEATRNILGGRQAGGNLVLQVQALAAPGDPDPCETDALLLGGGGDAIVAQVVAAGTEGSLAFDECRVGFFSGWVRVVLDEPLHNRLVDGYDGEAVELADSDDLLLPTHLPSGFPTVADHDEFGPDPATRSYSFSWANGDVSLSVTASATRSDCGGEPQVVRGVEGTRCEGELAIVVQWEEGGQHRQLEVADVGGNRLTVSLDDVLAVAEGLAPAYEVEAG